MTQQRWLQMTCAFGLVWAAVSPGLASAGGHGSSGLVIEIPLPRQKPTTRPATSRPSSRPHKHKKAQKRNPEECNTGCAAVKPHQGGIPRHKFVALAKKFAKEPLRSGSQALEILLFHANDSQHWLDQGLGDALPKAHLGFLRKELARRHAWVTLRVVDRKGRVRVRLGPYKVQIGKPFHYAANVNLGIQRPSSGGRVERVGLTHLWTRI